MKLVRLTLRGFKSFADQTELRFDDGITAIVGPNGCGKSNISDAIRWVLGEQRASAIRSSRMDDAIFQGTVQRRAVNRAEVGLVFSNENRRLPLPYDELEIRRTVFREGGSEYQLNRSPCRLKDIYDLCRDTGLGANAYAIIEQRMVDAILSDRAEERRALFEEAAGIGRYKDRRRAAQRRLESAEADLVRLDDLIGEVETKVRSLARQRGRAQKYQTLRGRRLALEVAVAAAELEQIEAELAAAAEGLSALAEQEPGARAALSAAEAELERGRLAAAESMRARQDVAERLEQVRRRVAERERELAVAQERRLNAEQRLGKIAVERAELRDRIAALEAELGELDTDLEARRAELAALELQVKSGHEQQEADRRALAEARAAARAARAREEDRSRRLVQMEADAAAAEARAAECEARLARLHLEQAELEADLAQLEEQRDLFVERERELRSARMSLESERAAAAAVVEGMRAEASAAGRRLADAEDAANRLSARLAALEALEREYHGFAPAVVAALSNRESLPDLLGPLAEELRLDPDLAPLVEATLGSLLQVLVVRDPPAADAVRDWLNGHAPDAGSLAILPKQALTHVDALLAAAVFAGSPEAEPILLGRQERLAALRQETAEAERERDAAEASRTDIAERVTAAEIALREVDARIQEVELELRRSEADEASRAGQRERAERARRALDVRRAELRAAVERAKAETVAAREARSELEAELAADKRSREEAAAVLTRHEADWEASRDSEAELRVAFARAESRFAELRRKHASAAEGLTAAWQRLRALDDEEADQRAALEALEGARQDGEEQLQRLSTERDAISAMLVQLDEQLASSTDAGRGLEARVRELRRAADERAETRHRIELRRAEAQAARRNVRERLEAEWAKPFEALAASVDPPRAEPDTLLHELDTVTADIARLGPINMLALEEHEEEGQRLEFLRSQRDDLTRAKDDLRSAIRQINRTARQLFLETFEQVQQNFRRTFQTLFEGGDCEIKLEDEDHPLESAIEISASPRGKRTQRIDLLSGGERSLTALALLFAIYLVKPSPFCVLDEVDAPLDEANIGRFVAMIQQFKAQTQFILITHNPRTMEAADWIYGVTMEEPGVSSIVGVELASVLQESA